jgi:hypothetical protein
MGRVLVDDGPALTGSACDVPETKARSQGHATKEGDMKLKEYMGTHDGAYTIAESTQSITVEDLDVTLSDLEVEPYLLGDDGAGRRKIHLYSVDQPFHIVTHVEEVKTSD